MPISIPKVALKYRNNSQCLENLRAMPGDLQSDCRIVKRSITVQQICIFKCACNKKYIDGARKQLKYTSCKVRNSCYDIAI